MNMAVVDGCFLSALQPQSSCTAYVVPSDGQSQDPSAKARRVREQVRTRLAENKSSSSLNWLDDARPVAMEYNPTEVKTLSHSLGFSSRSMIHTPTRVIAVPTVPLYTSGFSSRSAVETRSRVTSKETNTVQSTSQTQSRSRRSKSLSGEQDVLPLPVPACSEAVGVSGGSLRRSLSGILAQERGCFPQEEIPQHYTYKGPSHRTISRITNRQQQHGQQQSSTLGQDGWLGNGRGYSATGDTWRTQWQQQMSRAGNTIQICPSTPLQRAASLRSLRSVGKGVDVLEGASIHSFDPLREIQGLDMVTAVSYLSEAESALQVVGAAYIQHQCYHSNDAKNEVRALQGVPALVNLLSADNQEVQQFAAAATRNLIYENAANKAALIDAGGLIPLVSLLSNHDEELQKSVTGILWNLSSRDNLKEKLAVEALPALTKRVLMPLSKNIPLSPSERDIFNNTTGCLRNLSSINQRTRQRMRDTSGLLDYLVSYIQQEEKMNNKGFENSMCIMRNLSYQLYSELPPSARLHLEGPTRASAAQDSNTIGCFSLYNRRKPEQYNQKLPTLSQPKGADWLWHPKVVLLYKLVLQCSDSSATSRAAAIGALQNITAGEARWSALLSGRVIEQERMLPILMDQLDSTNDLELRPLTGLLQNLSRHCRDKEHVAKNVVSGLVSKLPSDGLEKSLSSEVVVNICGALNHLVTCTSLAARDITYYNGLPKLMGIKNSHDNSSGSLKAAKAASTVLCNMFQYSKLHRDYKLKGFTKQDFKDNTV
ncbi:plakophilin-3-like [Gouania willdenowi]|uniref:Plakophilin-3-like n=1 Tax=Gouania willdenowi TaxID=441366 RepID=A0A8C5EG03_GOUWI|nr:plakophilin-3-like [Gouania willdenowi]